MEHLKEASLLYREPALYAQMTDADAIDRAAAIIALAAVHGPSGAKSVLDLGCGTGAVLEQLACTYSDQAGVDLLPGMIDIAKKHRPELDLRVGDMRTVRLGRSFDVVICVGNALAYLIEPEDVQAAFATFAEHCVPGGLLIIQTPTVYPPLDRNRNAKAEVSGRHAGVVIRYTRDPRDETFTMTRHWNFEDGERTTDVVRRRVLSIEEQAVFANSVGFTHVWRSTRDGVTVFHREGVGGPGTGAASG
ncbi:class I SAM-dependent methyltransferase [Catenulispora sp. NL8]|uniref:Class I SAM-dependent methyltransferase n=1 Tax=Catenulispora pinistramenti TaxID=2705254 RepID=A0ABS5KJJ6_9ACTN|nr:class I SAM-dependent methyltransferase [Catenulispora pinistramenti]MBS2545501.1 class I SAM-dependent methyltransferase [Catenulispora pinistramenti]